MSGLFLTHPIGLWGLAAAAAAIILYLFYRRYRPQPVTGLFLWGEPRREGAGGRKVENPLVGRSLLLDLLAAALLGLILAGPAWRSASALPVVLILDDSFAMRSRNGHVEARRLADETLSAARGRGVETTIMLAGDRPTLLRSPGDYAQSELSALLEGYLPASESGDLHEALLLAHALYGTTPEVHVVTNRGDVDFSGTAGRVITHVLPGRGDNLAFVRAWRESGDAGHRERLVLIAVNHGECDVSATLSVTAGETGREQQVYSESVPLEPDKPSLIEISLALTGGETLTARLAAGDDADVIAADSGLHLPPAPTRTVRYFVDGDITAEAARYFNLALEAAGCAPAPWGEDGEPLADLLVTGDPGKKGLALTLEMAAPGEPAVFSPPYVVDSAHPLCRDVNLATIPWVSAGRDAPPSAVESYILAGDMPLYWRSSDGRLHLNLVPERCLIVNDPAWPVLMSNLVEEAARLLPGLGKNAYAPGEPLRYRPGPGQPARRLSFVRDGSTIAAPAARDPSVPRDPGLYRLRDGDGEVAAISVLPLFGAASDTTGLAAAAATYEPRRADGEEGEGAMDLSWLCLILAFVLLGANWRLARGSEGK